MKRDLRFVFRLSLYLYTYQKKKLENMKELLEKIAAKVAEFNTDAAAQAEKGNKAAGTRARKASLEIEKLMKEFRKESLEASR